MYLYFFFYFALPLNDLLRDRSYTRSCTRGERVGGFIVYFLMIIIIYIYEYLPGNRTSYIIPWSIYIRSTRPRYIQNAQYASVNIYPFIFFEKRKLYTYTFFGQKRTLEGRSNTLQHTRIYAWSAHSMFKYTALVQ